MIVFCTTCKGRTQHLERTLPANLRDNPEAKFVVLDYNSQDHLVSYLQTAHAEDIDAGRLVVYSYRESGPFRMAHAKNMAHRCGMLEGGDILVNLDADNFTGAGFADYIAREFSRNPNTFLSPWIWRPRGISGRIAVSTHMFLTAGGYDEKYETWSPDDKDFVARLERMGYEPGEMSPQFLDAIRHNEKIRFREYRHAKNDMGYEQFEQEVRDSDATVANFGNFGCGAVYRNFRFLGKPIEMNPIPTRIFGIGMHKTATTSLHHAFKRLGINSAHWGTPRWARNVWIEMTTEGRSKTLERHYALSDLPFTFLYQELDRSYPGSKYILTIRDETKWIQSVENHWSHERNPWRKDWGSDAFTHKAHKLLYGQKGFNRELFLARFRRHNAEVREYFRDRPADLLVMDMEAAGWPELCGFLGIPAPDVPYPVEFLTKG